MYKNYALFVCFVFSTLLLFSQNTELWKVELSLNDRLILPFFIEEKQGLDLPVYSVINGKEKIVLHTFKKKDSLKLSFPEMDSYLMIATGQTPEIRGYWKNNIKNQKFPFVAWKKDTMRFHSANNLPLGTVAEKYQVLFSTQEESPWPAVGLFEQNEQVLTGTFLTETGDFRYLEGNVHGNELFLSCFDGAHAFVFSATIKNDSLLGRFYSGSSYQTDWIGIKDDSARLKDPNELTYLTRESDDLGSVKLRKLNGLKTRLKLNKHSLYLIQIMGSWCPNCLDETTYFKELYSTYHKSGLQIISIGFEYGKTTRQQRKKLKRFVNKAQLKYPVFLGGSASKKQASKLFPMLNGISSFPTTLFVDEQGKIIHIHTGFNGPGTGEYYQQYTVETESLIEGFLHISP